MFIREIKHRYHGGIKKRLFREFNSVHRVLQGMIIVALVQGVTHGSDRGQGLSDLCEPTKEIQLSVSCSLSTKTKTILSVPYLVLNMIEDNHIWDFHHELA